MRKSKLNPYKILYSKIYHHVKNKRNGNHEIHFMIFLAGPISKELNMKEEDFQTSITIAVDGGYHLCEMHNLIPDIVLGDFDSYTVHGKKESLRNGERDKLFEPVVFPKEKDDTDARLLFQIMHNVLDTLKISDAKVDIFGGLLGRFDHTFALLRDLRILISTTSYLTVIDEQNTVFVLKEGTYNLDHLLHVQHTFFPILKTKKRAKSSSYISFFAEDDRAILSLRKMKYELDHRVIQFRDTYCISNEYTEANAEIEVHSGVLLAIFSSDIPGNMV